MLPRILEKTGQLDIFHANAGTYIGGDLVNADAATIDRMLNLNVNVVIKNVHDVLPHMIERGAGDIIVTSSVAGHFPDSLGAGVLGIQVGDHLLRPDTRRQVFKHGIRVGSVSPGPVVSALLADWPKENLEKAKAAGALIEPSVGRRRGHVHPDATAQRHDPRHRRSAKQLRRLTRRRGAPGRRDSRFDPPAPGRAPARPNGGAESLRLA